MLRLPRSAILFIAFAIVTSGANGHAVAPNPVMQPWSSDPGPLERRAKPVTAANPIPRRHTTVMPDNPMACACQPLVVDLRVTVDEQGRVGEVRPLGPARVPSGFFISKPFGGELVGMAPLVDPYWIRTNNWAAPADPRMSPATGYLTFIELSVDAVRRWEYDPPAGGPVVFDVQLAFRERSAETQILSPGVTVDARQTAGSFSPQGSPSSLDWTRNVARAEDVGRPIKVKDVAPVFPPIALSARIKGVVLIEARVDIDGRVTHAHVVQSSPFFDKHALESVMQWEFSPTLVNGKPIPVLVTLDLTFMPF